MCSVVCVGTACWAGALMWVWCTAPHVSCGAGLWKDTSEFAEALQKEQKAEVDEEVHPDVVCLGQQGWKERCGAGGGPGHDYYQKSISFKRDGMTVSELEHFSSVLFCCAPLLCSSVVLLCYTLCCTSLVHWRRYYQQQFQIGRGSNSAIRQVLASYVAGQPIPSKGHSTGVCCRSAHPQQGQQGHSTGAAGHRPGEIGSANRVGALQAWLSQ